MMMAAQKMEQLLSLPGLTRQSITKDFFEVDGCPDQVRA
jgi:hypothetical protein